MNIEKHIIHYKAHPLNYEIIVDESGYWAIDEAGYLIHNDKIVRVCLEN